MCAYCSTYQRVTSDMEEENEADTAEPARTVDDDVGQDGKGGGREGGDNCLGGGGGVVAGEREILTGEGRGGGGGDGRKGEGERFNGGGEGGKWSGGKKNGTSSKASKSKEGVTLQAVLHRVSLCRTGEQV